VGASGPAARHARLSSAASGELDINPCQHDGGYHREGGLDDTDDKTEYECGDAPGTGPSEKKDKGAPDPELGCKEHGAKSYEHDQDEREQAEILPAGQLPAPREQADRVTGLNRGDRENELKNREC